MDSACRRKAFELAMSLRSVGVKTEIARITPADTFAEIEAYCVSNDGKNTVISYEDYLTLSEVARLNFDFKIRSQ